MPDVGKFAIDTYTAGVGQLEYTITFPWLREYHIHAYIDEIETIDWTINGTVLTFGGTVIITGGETVQIVRETPNTYSDFVFDPTNADYLDATDLETLTKQLLYVSQEFWDNGVSPSSIQISMIADVIGPSFRGRLSTGTGGIADFREFQVTEELTPGAGDYALGFLADGSIVKYDVTNLPGAAGGTLNAVVEDTSPQLGGQLDSNGNSIRVASNLAIRDENNAELIRWFGRVGAVNRLKVENHTTGNNPGIRAEGSDTDVSLSLYAKGAGTISMESDLYLTTNNLLVQDSRGIRDDADNELLRFQKTANAVNHLDLHNAATGTGPLLIAVGDDTDIDFRLQAKGTGELKMQSVVDFGSTNAYFNEDDNATTTVDWTASNKQRKTLTANAVLSFTDPAGPCNLVFRVIQDVTGGWTITWPASVKWAGGVAPTLTSDPNAVDIICFYFDGTNYYGSSLLDLQ